MNEAEPDRDAHDRRALTRLGLLVFVVLFGYMAVWGYGWFFREQCPPSVPFFVGLASLAVPFFYGAFVAAVVLYSLCLGHANETARFLSLQRQGAKNLIRQLYDCAPTLTVLAGFVILGSVFSLFFRYHTYRRVHGVYQYDRLLHIRIYDQEVQCPPDDSEPDR